VSLDRQIVGYGSQKKSEVGHVEEGRKREERRGNERKV